MESMVTDIPTAQSRDVLGNNVDTEKSRQTSWLYQCMISKCSCTFERLADLRMHFVDSHQSDQMAVPCCFCTKEFPVWNSAVTSHVASHVKIKSIRCIECSLSFASKEALMSHLHSCHSRLPEGICIDVSIENHERRHLPCDTDGTEISSSGKVPCTVQQQDSSEKTPDFVRNVVKNVNCINTNKAPVSGGHSVQMESDRCSSVSDIHVDESSSRISLEDSSCIPQSHTDNNNLKDLVKFSATKTCRRKPRKPSHIFANDTECSDFVHANDCNWVEIVAATQPMIARCPHCTFTCNTELQLKVHVYECHDKPRGSRYVLSSAMFTCKHCGASATTLATHCSHLAHHQSSSSDLIRIFSCVYCRCRSDSIETLEKHVASYHPLSEMKFEVQQSSVSYLQGMMTCPVCLGAFSWKEDLLHHFGAVHHLEELVVHLESEFTCETCPPCCRVRQTLFKNLLPEQANGIASSVRVSDSSYCAEGNQFSTTECLHTGSPARKILRSDANGDDRTKNSEIHCSPQHRQSDGAHSNGDGRKRKSQICSSPEHRQSDSAQDNGDSGSRKSENRSSPRRRLSEVCAESIERYHCDLCEFSANDINELLKHVSELHSEKTPSLPPTPDTLPEPVSEETDGDRSPRKQVQKRHFCDFCPFSTKWPHTLREHMNFHKRSALVKVGYKCAYCNIASVHNGSVRLHQNVCHHHQPVKILRISGGKVVKGSSNVASVSKAVESKSSPSSSVSAAKKQNKVKLSSKSEFIAIKYNSRISQKTVTNKQSGTASSLNMNEASVSDQERSAVALERKLPEQMIYPTPVYCPLCNFSSRARVNLVRHIRLNHDNQRHSQTRTSQSYPLNYCEHGYLDKSTTLPLQIEATLPALIMKADTVGVFVPSVDENAVDSCLDRHHASYVSELAASVSHYPLAVSLMTSIISNLDAELLQNQDKSDEDTMSALDTSTESAGDIDTAEVDDADINTTCDSTEQAKANAQNVDAEVGADGQKYHFRCRYCGYGNVRIAAMRQHIMAKHLNYRPHSCSLCDFRSTKSCYVKQHIHVKHPTASNVKLLYLPDVKMASRLKNGFYSFCINESAENYLPVLQDHTYNAVSTVVGATTASSLHQNVDNIKTLGRKPSDNHAAEVTDLETNKLRTDSGNENLYHCEQCTYLGLTSRALKLHITKKHRGVRKSMLKCQYCSVLHNRSADMLVHWYNSHQNMPFKYHSVNNEVSADDHTTQEAPAEMAENECLHASSESDISMSHVPEANIPSSEAAVSISALTHESADTVPCGEVDDIIYCCETCPSSFSTPEALSLHECTSVAQQAVV